MVKKHSCYDGGSTKYRAAENPRLRRKPRIYV